MICDIDRGARLESHLPDNSRVRRENVEASVETPFVANEALSPNSNLLLNSNTYTKTFDTYGKTFYG